MSAQSPLCHFKQCWRRVPYTSLAILRRSRITFASGSRTAGPLIARISPFEGQEYPDALTLRTGVMFYLHSSIVRPSLVT
jgi:hypothetical protein